MALGDYILCCKCECKLIYDGDKSQREWWEERFGKPPQIECPDCKSLAQPEPEPVAQVGMYSVIRALKPLSFGTLLYASPPKREPLTDEEADELVQRFARYELLRAIEAAHGIKENT